MHGHPVKSRAQQFPRAGVLQGRQDGTRSSDVGDRAGKPDRRVSDVVPLTWLLRNVSWDGWFSSSEEGLTVPGIGLAQELHVHTVGQLVAWQQ